MKKIVAKFANTTEHGTIAGKAKTHMIDYYNLDVIISIGYRVNSKKATQFRIWATSVLKNYVIKGFKIDKERINNWGEN